MDTTPAPVGRITLLREIATGPVSSLFVARRDAPRRPARLVAVKVVRHRSPRDVERLVHMRDAARELAALGHRHIVCACELGVVGGHPALLTPYVEGVDLLDWVEVLRETGDVLPGRVICEVLRSVAVALDAAHNRSVPGGHEPLARVHRDIKPSNLMVDRDGELKVLDWGTGFTSIAGRHARSGALQKGLSKYLSPARREGKRGGPSSDVYATGILGIELFRGRWLRRLRAQNPAHDRHLAEVVATMGDLGMRTTADDATLRSLLLRMVAHDPDARPQASEVAHTFRTLADRAGGPCLESFAHAHALPWLEPVPSQPDADLEDHEVSLLDTDATASDLPTVERFPNGGVHVRERDSDVVWDETDEGWIVAGRVETASRRPAPRDAADASPPEGAPTAVTRPRPPPPRPAPAPEPSRSPAPSSGITAAIEARVDRPEPAPVEAQDPASWRRRVGLAVAGLGVLGLAAAGLAAAWMS